LVVSTKITCDNSGEEPPRCQSTSEVFETLRLWVAGMLYSRAMSVAAPPPTAVKVNLDIGQGVWAAFEGDVRFPLHDGQPLPGAQYHGGGGAGHLAVLDAQEKRLQLLDPAQARQKPRQFRYRAVGDGAPAGRSGVLGKQPRPAPGIERSAIISMLAIDHPEIGQERSLPGALRVRGEEIGENGNLLFKSDFWQKCGTIGSMIALGLAPGWRKPRYCLSFAGCGAAFVDRCLQSGWLPCELWDRIASS
jgi:hypothetical protein